MYATDEISTEAYRNIMNNKKPFGQSTVEYAQNITVRRPLAAGWSTTNIASQEHLLKD